MPISELSQEDKDRLELLELKRKKYKSYAYLLRERKPKHHSNFPTRALPIGAFIPHK